MRRISSNLVYYGLSIGLMKGLSLIILPIVSRYLTPAQMGQLELLTTIAIFVSLFVAAGLEDCLFRFAKCKADEKSVAASFYGWSLTFGSLFYVGAWLSAPAAAKILGNDITALQLQIIWAGIALEGAITLPLALMRMRQRAGLFFSFVIGRTFFQAALTLILLSQSASVTSLLIASLSATLLQAGTLAIWQLKAAGIAPRLRELRPIGIYGLPLLGSGLCMFALNGVDRWAIAHFDNLITLGLYSVGAKFALATVLLMQPFGMWWRPQRFARLDQCPRDCGRILMTGLLLLAIISASVICFAPILMQWLMPAAYQAAISMTLAITLIFTLREAAEIINLGVLSKNNTLVLLKINIATAAFGLMMCLIATAQFGVWGCISALISAQFLRTLAVYLASQRVSPLVIPSRLILTLLTGLMILAAVANHLVPPKSLNDQLSLMALWLLSTAVFVALYSRHQGFYAFFIAQFGSYVRR